MSTPDLHLCFHFFLYCVANTRLNHWTKCVIRNQLVVLFCLLQPPHLFIIAATPLTLPRSLRPTAAPRNGGSNNKVGIMRIWGTSPPRILQNHSLHQASQFPFSSLALCNHWIIANFVWSLQWRLGTEHGLGTGHRLWSQCHICCSADSSNFPAYNRCCFVLLNQYWGIVAATVFPREWAKEGAPRVLFLCLWLVLSQVTCLLSTRKWTNCWSV